MITQTSSSAPLAKIQSIIFLGLGCNSTTLIGCVAVWIALSKIGVIQNGIIESALLVLSFAPIFMADAISNYVLGRIRLEYEKDWDDVLITEKARETTAKFYKVYRALSIVPAYLLAAVFVAAQANNAQIYNYLLIAFIVAFAFQYVRTVSFIHFAIAPVKENFGGTSLVKRALMCFGVFCFIVWSIKSCMYYPKSTIFWTGMIYFALAAILQPLPTQFSIFPKRREIRRVYDSNSPANYSIIVSNDSEGNEEVFINQENVFENEGETKTQESQTVEEAEIVEETNG